VREVPGAVLAPPWALRLDAVSKRKDKINALQYLMPRSSFASQLIDASDHVLSFRAVNSIVTDLNIENCYKD
jgi:hypothetical protein